MEDKYATIKNELRWVSPLREKNLSRYFTTILQALIPIALENKILFGSIVLLGYGYLSECKVFGNTCVHRL